MRFTILSMIRIIKVCWDWRRLKQNFPFSWDSKKISNFHKFPFDLFEFVKAYFIIHDFQFFFYKKIKNTLSIVSVNLYFVFMLVRLACAWKQWKSIIVMRFQRRFYCLYYVFLLDSWPWFFTGRSNRTHGVTRGYIMCFVYFILLLLLFF